MKKLQYVLEQINPSHVPDDNEQPEEERVEAQLYRAPHLIPVGKAVHLLQSYSWGGYADTYTGYYWNR